MTGDALDGEDLGPGDTEDEDSLATDFICYGNDEPSDETSDLTMVFETDDDSEYDMDGNDHLNHSPIEKQSGGLADAN